MRPRASNQIPARSGHVRIVGGWFVMTVLVSATFVGLSLWQCRRAAETRALKALWEDHTTLKKFDPVGAAVYPEAVLYRRVTIQGVLMGERQLLIDNQIAQGRVGYHVLTPLHVVASDTVLLVNRGWVAAPLDRSRRPVIDQPTGIVTVRGILDHFPRVALRLPGADVPQGAWPKVVQLIDPIHIRDSLQSSTVLPWQLLLDPTAPDGYLRDWHKDQFNPARNISYAVQWLLFAALAWGMFVRFRLSHRNQSR